MKTFHRKLKVIQKSVIHNDARENGEQQARRWDLIVLPDQLGIMLSQR